MKKIVKKCEIHNSFDKYKNGRCLQCGRDRAKEWNRKNIEHCREMNKKYYIDKKEKIAKRKAKLYKENHEKMKLSSRKTALKMKYNLTLEEYDKLTKKK